MQGEISGRPSAGGVKDALFGGWLFNVVTALQTGYPLGITQSNSNSVIAACAQRPNATGLSPVVEGSATV